MAIGTAALHRVPRTPARAAVVAQILSLFRSGAIRPGDFLPTESQLMQLTGVGRSTVREAIRTLETMQLIEVRQGRGTVATTAPGEALDDPQMLLFISDHRALRDLFDVRRAIEPMIARLAAQRATADDIGRLGRALSSMDATPHDVSRAATWREAHLEFHAALARAAHNVVASRMWASVSTFLRESPLIPPGPPETWQGVAFPIHVRLYQAVAGADAVAAVAAMESHMDHMASMLGDETGSGGQRQLVSPSSAQDVTVLSRAGARRRSNQ